MSAALPERDVIVAQEVVSAVSDLPPGRAPSIADVARIAGVSTQTVSRVSTGAPHVRPATRALVEEAMDAVGYTPNAAARALRSGSFQTLGVIVHQISRTGESRTVEAIVEAARRSGYTVSLVDVERATDTALRAAVSRLEQQLIDGLIVVRHEATTPVDLRIPDSMPAVVSDSRFLGDRPVAGVDQPAGTRTAIRHLLDLGHRTVHHISGPPMSNPAAVRRTAWQAALVEAERSVPAPVVGDWSPEAGLAAGRELLRRRAEGEEVTAIFAANDEIATGAILALTEQGVRVPQDVSIIGFDNIPLAGYLTPPLTTVEQDFRRLGDVLVELLLEQVRRQQELGRRAVPADVDATPRHEGDAAPARSARGGVAAGRERLRVVVPANLIVRASTAPPPTLP